MLNPRRHAFDLSRVCAASLWAYITAKFVDVVTNADPDETEYKNKLDDVNAFINFYAITNRNNDGLKSRLREYMANSRYVQTAQAHERVTRSLSPDLRAEVAFTVHSRWISARTTPPPRPALGPSPPPTPFTMPPHNLTPAVLSPPPATSSTSPLPQPRAATAAKPSLPPATPPSPEPPLAHHLPTTYAPSAPIPQTPSPSFKRQSRSYSFPWSCHLTHVSTLPQRSYHRRACT